MNIAILEPTLKKGHEKKIVYDEYSFYIDIFCEIQADHARNTKFIKLTFTTTGCIHG